MLCDLCVLGVIGFGGTQKRLEGDEGGFEGKNGGPGVLEDVEADGARGGGDVRVVDFGDEFHLDRLERVRFGDYDVLWFRVRLRGMEIAGLGVAAESWERG